MRSESFLVCSSQKDRIVDKLVTKTDRSDHFTAHNTDLLVLDSRRRTMLELKHPMIDKPKDVWTDKDLANLMALRLLKQL